MQLACDEKPFEIVSADLERARAADAAKRVGRHKETRMKKGVIDLSQMSLDGIDAEYFANVLSYYNKKIQKVEYDPVKKEAALTYLGTQEEFDAIIDDILAKLGRSKKNHTNEVVFTRVATTPNIDGDVWEEMVREGIVFDYGQGHVAYGGLFFELFENIDYSLTKMLAKRSARPMYLPNFVSIDYLKKLGLVDEFPQYLFFVAPLAQDIGIIENFQKEKVLEREALQTYLEAPQYCLKTAACSMLYPIIENTDFDEPVYFTTLGSIARRESLNIKTCERLTEFHQREIVFIGDDEGVKGFIRFSQDLFRTLIETFNLTASISAANDSFFVSNYSKLRFMQALGQDKYEALVTIPSTKAKIAFASCNNHRGFFSKRFGFTYRGDEAATACVGVGLERLVYATISQHGLDRAKLLEMVAKFKEKCEQL